jgi:hypothetical protein
LIEGSGSLFEFPMEELKHELFCLGPEILIPPKGFSASFLAFLGGLGSIGVFRLQARVLEALAMDSAEGSLEDSALGSRADIGMAGIEMSPSNPGIGEVMLSKSCIQEIGI